MRSQGPRPLSQGFLRPQEYRRTHQRQHTSCGEGQGHERRARDGEQSMDWESIVDQHSDRVFRLALRLTGNRHDAEDLTQEVFVRVFRSLHTYQPGTFEGWLHRITTNLFLDQARRTPADPLRRAVRRARGPHRERRRRPRHGLRRPHLRRRRRGRARGAAAGLPCRGGALRHRGPDLRGDRRDPRRQARHRPLAHPPRPGHAPGRAGPPCTQGARTRYAGPAPVVTGLGRA